MIQIKILFTDIDGTLLNKERQLSNPTKYQINRINKELGVVVILVSARMPKSMRLLQSELGLNNDIICYNGSLILGANDHEITRDEKIDPELCRAIARRAQAMDLHAGYFLYNTWIVNRLDKWAEREKNNTRVSPELLTDLNIKLLDKGLHKIMLMGDPKSMDALQEWIKKSYAGELNFYRSKDTYLELNSMKADKLEGVKLLLSQRGYNFNQAMAIGDNYNDLEMIKYAGLGVAVNNAPDEIKKIANFIAPSNVDDGVSFTIKSFFRDEDISKPQ